MLNVQHIKNSFGNITPENKFYILLFIPLFCVIFLSIFYARPFYNDFAVEVPPGHGEKLYIDTGYGYHDWMSIPITENRAIIKNAFVDIALIRNIAVTDAAGNFVGVPLSKFESAEYSFRYIAYQLPASFCIAFLLVMLLVKRHALLTYFKQSDFSCLFLTTLSLTILLGWAYILSPQINSDSYVPYSALAYAGRDSFTPYYKILFTLSYVLFGHPSTLIQILTAVSLSAIVISVFNVVRKSSRTLAYISYAIMMAMPFLYNEMKVGERGFAGIMSIAALLVMLSIHITGKGRGWSVFSVFLACLATLVRQDLGLYLCAVIFFCFYLHDKRIFVPLLKALFLATVILASAQALDMVCSPDYAQIVEGRTRVSLASIFGYALRENLLTDDELAFLSDKIDIDRCKKEWAEGSWAENVAPCAHTRGLTSDETRTMGRIFISKVRERPLMFLQSRLRYASLSIECILGLWNYKAVHVAEYVRAVQNGEIRAEGETGMAARFNRAIKDPFSVLLVRYGNLTYVQHALFYMLIAVVLSAAFLQKGREKFFTLPLLGITLIGPMGKFASLTLMAPMVYIEYMLDLVLFVLFILPVLIVQANINFMRSRIV